eukprot:354398-Chlamydomonas_euryale.AAC.4
MAAGNRMQGSSCGFLSDRPTGVGEVDPPSPTILNLRERSKRSPPSRRGKLSASCKQCTA